MEKGQISIDLLITLIVVIMIIAAFTVILNGYKSGQEQIFLENQMDKISYDLASFITSSQSISDTNFIAEIMIPNVQYENTSRTPQVRVDTDEIVVSFNNGVDIFEKRAFFSKNPKMNISINGKKLVILNE